MDLDGQIAALKAMVQTERDFGVLMCRFLDIAEDGDALHARSVPAIPCADLAGMFTRVAESSLRRRVTITLPMWLAVPSLHLGYSMMRVNGHLASAFYFDDLGCGLIGISLGHEMRYSRFRFAVPSPIAVDPSWN